jgi:hypothetical protein
MKRSTLSVIRILNTIIWLGVFKETVHRQYTYYKAKGQLPRAIDRASRALLMRLLLEISTTKYSNGKATISKM